MRVTEAIKIRAWNFARIFAVLFAFASAARANVNVSPTSVSFGNQSVGTTSTPRTVKLTNWSRRSIQISSVSTSESQFSYSAPSMPVYLRAGHSLTVSVAFDPSAAQSYSGTLTFTRSNGYTISVSLMGTGTNGGSASVAPTITSQPASVKITSGQTATFSVAATGTVPLTYQWKMNGAAISSATSSTYTTPAETTANNNAQFTVFVSNSAGSATSNAATLAVSAAMAILEVSTSSLNFGNVNVSSTGTQTVTLTNVGTASVTISNVTVSGAGFNATGVSAGLILNAGQVATLTATFTPGAAGAATGGISITGNASPPTDSISLSGTGVAVANHSVALSWTASTSTVVGYNAYSSTQSGGPYTKLTNGPVSGTTYTDSTVQSGKNYFYVVTAVDASNVESAYSSEVSALIP